MKIISYTPPTFNVKRSNVAIFENKFLLSHDWNTFIVRKFILKKKKYIYIMHIYTLISYHRWDSQFLTLYSKSVVLFSTSFFFWFLFELNVDIAVQKLYLNWLKTKKKGRGQFKYLGRCYKIKAFKLI